MLGMGLLDLLRKCLWAIGDQTRTTPSMLYPWVSTMVIQVAVVVVLLIPVCQVQLMVSGSLSWASVVVFDKAAAR